MEEPSVLDYVKAKLMPWRGIKIDIPPAEVPAEALSLNDQPDLVKPPLSTDQIVPTTNLQPVISLGSGIRTLVKEKAVVPWRSLTGIGLGLFAQLSLEPGPDRTWQIGFILYLFAAGMLVWSYLSSEWVEINPPPPAVEHMPTQFVIRTWPFLVSLILAGLAFASMGGNEFTAWNVIVWGLALATMIWALWQPGEPSHLWLHRLRNRLTAREWRVKIDRWTLLIVAAILVVIFFRVYRIQQVPGEMVSDQAEKILDVWEVVNGKTSIFFPRNTGREAIQMYLTAGIVLLFRTGFSYISLKIGTVLAGLLTLPYIYLLGKEFGNRRIALYALFFAGIAYWPNVISRVGLRFPLFPLFVAPVLYYLMRGLRTSRLNDFLLAGLFLGLGLHGYTPIRILPFGVLLAVGLYLLHRQVQGGKAIARQGLLLLVLASFYVFIPLFRYALESPDMFSYRSFTRLGTVEQPLPGPAGSIFLSNLGRALAMFAWDDGEIWVHSIIHRPALDVVSAALFYLGSALLFIRYLRKRDWRDIFWLLSVPVLMMPSILSLAFPAENPALNRMAGAIVPVFLIVAFCLDGLLQTVKTRIGSKLGSALAVGIAACLAYGAIAQNYDLVFHQYSDAYRGGAWNTSEMGQVIHDFASSVGSADTAWVLAYPYWVDTRLVGMNAGYPTRDYAISVENLPNTMSDRRAKLFLIKPEDTSGLDTLRGIYPNGVLQVYTSQVEGHEFWLFFVPPSS
jgi:hypothetical protein